MGQLSFEASNAITYLTYGAFLILGTGLAWSMRNQPKSDFLSGNRTQTAIPLALNFIASAIGSGILFAYPQVATIAGVQGVVVYALSSALPLLVFAALGPKIRRKCPEGFVLTEWTLQRYGRVPALYLGVMTLLTLFLYMVAELSAIGQVVSALAGLDALPVVVVQCVVTTVYTTLGGFKISFLTDNIQGAMVAGLVVIASIAVGVETRIDPALVESSGLTLPSLLGWQLLYILPVAILTNDFFLSNFWLRTFASKTDRDLWIGVGAASAAVLVILALVGCAGLAAVWSGAWPGPDGVDGSVAFFMLLLQLPTWVVGLVLIMAVTLSTAAFDSLQSAMVSSASNDLFRNRLGVWWIRGAVVIVMIPVVATAVRAPSVLQIYLISDLVSAAVIPVLVLGLSDRFFWWLCGFEVVAGGLGGLLSVFIFGTVYYGDARSGARLLLLDQGLYTGDWGAFGAFVAAPIGGLVSCAVAALARLGALLARSRLTGHPFVALERPPVGAGLESGGYEDALAAEGGAEESPASFAEQTRPAIAAAAAAAATRPGKF